MPFDFLKRKKAEAPRRSRPPTPVAAPTARGIPFVGLTEEWRLAGGWTHGPPLRRAQQARAVPIAEVRWAPVDGSAPLDEAPGLRASTRTT